MRDMTRRSAIAAAASALAAPALVRAQSLGSGGRIAVIGAGVFGAWTAEHLRRAGAKVVLLDAWGVRQFALSERNILDGFLTQRLLHD